MTYKQFGQMAIMLLSRLQNAFGKVDATRVLFDAQKQLFIHESINQSSHEYENVKTFLPRYRRAVNKR